MRGIRTKESGKWKKVMISAFLFLVLILLLNSVSKVYKKKKEAEKTLAHMQEQIFDLKRRNELLKNDIQKLNTKEGIEFEIRKKLNVAQVGESVAIVVENNEVPTTTPVEFSFWQKLKNTINKLFK